MLLDLKGKAQAEAWRNQLNDLNEETNTVLRNVSSCIDEIKSESAGDPVEQLVVTAADMVDAAAEVIKGLRGLESAVKTVIAEAIKWAAQAAQAVADKRNQATNL